MILEFSLHIFEKYISNFMKIRAVGAKLFHVDGRTDITKLTVFFFFVLLPTRLKTRKTET